jgi:hypothetical protein
MASLNGDPLYVGMVTGGLENACCVGIDDRSKSRHAFRVFHKLTYVRFKTWVWAKRIYGRLRTSGVGRSGACTGRRS